MYDHGKIDSNITHWDHNAETVTKYNKMEMISIKYVILGIKNIGGRVRKHSEYILRIN